MTPSNVKRKVRGKNRRKNLGLILLVVLSSVLAWFLAEFTVSNLRGINYNSDSAAGGFVLTESGLKPAQSIKSVRPGATAAAFSRLKVSANRRYLTNQEGEPVYLLGGTAWTMPDNATREDVQFYLNTRKAQGFNYFQIVAGRDLDESETLSTEYPRDMNQANRYGHRPFNTRGGRTDPANPLVNAGGTPDNPNDYWDHVDYIIEQARAREMYVGFLPTWGKYYISNSRAEINLFTEANSFEYGRFLGDRYGGYSNIIWILGGDIPLGDAEARGTLRYVRKMAEGIINGATGQTVAYNQNSPVWDEQLITYHGRPAAAALANNDAWLKLNMLYEDDPELYPNTIVNYNNAPTRPMIQGESAYEGWTYAGLKSPQLIRRQAYHNFFGGALGGYVYGCANSSEANMAEGKQDQVFRFKADGGWRSRLNLPGASSLPYLKRLLDGHEWWKWIPDQGVISSGAGSGSGQKAALRSTDNDEILVYFADNTSAVIDMGSVRSHSNVRSTWYNPATGNTQAGGVYAAASVRSFMPPTSWNDAVLVLEGTDDTLNDTGPPDTKGIS